MADETIANRHTFLQGALLRTCVNFAGCMVVDMWSVADFRIFVIEKITT